MDPRRFIIQGKGERLVRYLDKGFDEVCGLVRELGEKWNNMTRVNVLVNADGFNVVQHACIPCKNYAYINNFFSNFWSKILKLKKSI